MEPVLGERGADAAVKRIFWEKWWENGGFWQNKRGNGVFFGVFGDFWVRSVGSVGSVRFFGEHGRVWIPLQGARRRIENRKPMKTGTAKPRMDTNQH